MIVKRGSKYLVMDSKGKKVLGTHASKESAEKQLTAIHISQKEQNESKVVSFSDFIKEELATLEYHDQLNPKFWDGFELKPEVREKLIEIGNAWIEWAEFPMHSVKEYLLVGGNANFNYTNKSDVDLHIIVDSNEIADCPDFIEDYFDSKKELWSSKHTITIYGSPVEISPRDIDEPIPENQGIFSIINNKWLSKPVHLDINLKDIPGSEKINDYKKEIESSLMGTDGKEEIQDIKSKLKNLRKSSLQQSGEFGLGNLIFKELRNLGYFDKMNQILRAKQDEDLSL